MMKKFQSRCISKTTTTTSRTPTGVFVLVKQLDSIWFFRLRSTLLFVSYEYFIGPLEITNWALMASKAIIFSKGEKLKVYLKNK